MNRNFFADDDKEVKERVHEVELLRSLMKSIYRPNQPEKFKMFLDIHAHSTNFGAFIFAPEPDDAQR